MIEKSRQPARDEPDEAQPTANKPKPRKKKGCYRPDYSAENGDIKGRSRRPASGRGGFQQYNEVRDNRRAPEPGRDHPQERGKTRDHNLQKSSASSTVDLPIGSVKDDREVQGSTNRHAVQSSEGLSDLNLDFVQPSANRRPDEPSLPQAPSSKPKDKSRPPRFHHPSTQVPANLRQWQQASSRTLSSNITPMLMQQRQMQTSHPDRPTPSIEENDVNPTGPPSGLDVLMNPAYCGTSRSRTVSGPPAPCATEVYLAQAKLPCFRRDSPQRLLLVLDLNGTLIARERRHQPELFSKRPGLAKFFDYIFTHHSVMIYTSSQPKTVNVVLPMLLTKKQRKRLVAVWDRTDLDLTPRQYVEKVQVYKRLEKIWADPDIQATYRPAPAEKEKEQSKGPGTWNQMNTVLIDDSELKALAQPHNLLQIREFEKNTPLRTKEVRKREERVLEDVVGKLEELRYQVDVSRLIRLWQVQVGTKEVPKAPLMMNREGGGGLSRSREMTGESELDAEPDPEPNPDPDPDPESGSLDQEVSISFRKRDGKREEMSVDAEWNGCVSPAPVPIGAEGEGEAAQDSSSTPSSTSSSEGGVSVSVGGG